MQHRLQRLVGRRGHFDEDRFAFGVAAVHAVQHQAVKVNVEIGRRAKSLDQRDREPGAERTAELTAAGSPTIADARPLQLQAEGIRKRFGTNEVLNGLGVRAHAGDVISMIGSSGSGKSTFLRCLNLLEQPNAGRIVVGGDELALVPDPRSPDGALKAQDP